MCIDMANPHETISPSSLTEKEWAEIRTMAINMLESGIYGTDQFKISICAFMIWAENYERQLEVLQLTNGPLH